MPFAPRVIETRGDLTEIYGKDGLKILEKTNVSNLLGVFSQLNDMSKYASEIFEDILQDTERKASRIRKCHKRIDNLGQYIEPIENAFVHNSPDYFYNNPYTGDEFRRYNQTEGLLFRRDLSSQAINLRRNECEQLPDLSSMDKFGKANDPPCILKYSNPEFFILQWIEEEQKKYTEEKKKRKKRREAKKNKKKRQDKKVIKSIKIKKFDKDTGESYIVGGLDEEVKNQYQMQNRGVRKSDSATGKSNIAKLAQKQKKKKRKKVSAVIEEQELPPQPPAQSMPPKKKSSIFKKHGVQESNTIAIAKDHEIIAENIGDHPKPPPPPANSSLLGKIAKKQSSASQDNKLNIKSSGPPPNPMMGFQGEQEPLGEGEGEPGQSAVQPAIPPVFSPNKNEESKSQAPEKKKLSAHEMAMKSAQESGREPPPPNPMMAAQKQQNQQKSQLSPIKPKRSPLAGGLLGQISAGKKLRKVDMEKVKAEKPKPKTDFNSMLMAGIRGGVALKKVEKKNDDDKPKKVLASPLQKILELREKMKYDSESEEESDSADWS